MANALQNAIRHEEGWRSLLLRDYCVIDETNVKLKQNKYGHKMVILVMCFGFVKPGRKQHGFTPQMMNTDIFTRLPKMVGNGRQIMKDGHGKNVK